MGTYRSGLAVWVVAIALTGAAQAVPFTAELPAEMMGYNDVVSGSAGGHWSTPPAPASSLNINNFLGANRFYGAGYDGSNSVAGNVEAGHIWAGHETLGHLALTQHLNPLDPNAGAQTGDVDRHATWVGMHIGGRLGGQTQGAWQEGIAYNATLWSGAIATTWNPKAPPPPRYSLSFNFTNKAFLDPYVAFFQTGIANRTADAVNSSWGFDDNSVNPQQVEAGAHPLQWATDGLSNANPLTTFVASAGNDGDGPNTVRGLAAGFNVIAVGALTSDAPPQYDFVANFSSRSPNSYWDPVNGYVYAVRAAVDIAAPGTNLTAAYYGGTTGGNSNLLGGAANGPAGGANWYTGQLAGTSFAAPIVAGGVALVDDAGYAVFPANPNARDARVVKAVLQNAADKDLLWTNNQQLVAGVITTTQSLDWESGAGRMDLDRAFDQYLPSAVGGMAGTTDVLGLGGGNVEPIGWDYGVVSAGQPNDYFIIPKLAGGTEFRATLDWFRDRTLNVIDGTVQDISFDNLDLEVWLTVGGVPVVKIAQSVSVYNNVEHLSLTLPQTGNYMIRVPWIGELFDEIGDLDQEIYGLAWWGEEPAVPEPATLSLIGAGLLLLVRRRRRSA